MPDSAEGAAKIVGEEGGKEAGSQGSSHGSGNKMRLKFFFFSFALAAFCSVPAPNAAQGNIVPSLVVLPDHLQLSQLAEGFHHD